MTLAALLLSGCASSADINEKVPEPLTSYLIELENGIHLTCGPGFTPCYMTNPNVVFVCEEVDSVEKFDFRRCFIMQVNADGASSDG